MHKCCLCEYDYPKGSGTKLISGPNNIYICQPCVSLCVGIIAGAVAKDKNAGPALEVINQPTRASPVAGGVA